MSLFPTLHRPAAETSPAATAPFEGHLPGTEGYRRVLVSLFVAGLATFVLMYDTQGLLPELSRAYGVSPSRATLTMSLATGALALALLVAGPLSEVLGRTRLIRASLVASTGIAFATALAPTWSSLLGLRALAGVALAGLPAVATAYLREEIHPSAQARATGLYIGGTALGGMAGRLVTAPVADVAGWRWAMAAAGAAALVCTVTVLVTLPASRNHEPSAVGLGTVAGSTRRALAEPALVALYLTGMCSVGALVATFNALGFRLTAPPHLLSLGAISLLYLTYGLGTVSSTVSGHLADTFGRRSVAPYGCLIAVAGALLTLSHHLPLIVLGLAALVVGFFVVHGLASGWVAARAHHAGISASQGAALYLSAYYVGSSVFGNLGSSTWSSHGWSGVVALTVTLLVVCTVLLGRLRRIPALV